MAKPKQNPKGSVYDQAPPKRGNGSPFGPTFPGVAESRYVPQKPPLTGNPQTDAILQGGKVKPPPRQQPISVHAVASVLDPLGYLVAGEPFSKTNAGKLAAGKISPKQFVTSPFEQHGQVNAGMAPIPFGRGIGEALAGRRAAKALLRGPNRTPEEASKHIAEAIAVAKSEGHGYMHPSVQKLKPGEETAATGGKAGAAVRAGLAGKPDTTGMGPFEKMVVKDELGTSASKAFKTQEQARSAERSKRVGMAYGASENPSGLSRHIAAKSKLSGQLPAGTWPNFQGTVAENVDQLVNHIYDHPHLRMYEKVRASDAILKGVNGSIPTPSEQDLLARAFGKQQAGTLVEKIKQHTLADWLNIPRSLMSSGDLSAPFRQGLAAMAYKPSVFLEGFGPMVKGAVSEGSYQAKMRAIHEDPWFPVMEKGGVAFTDIGTSAKAGVANISNREERFGSNLAEQIPGIGHVVRFSDRGYTGFLNDMRAKLFKLMAQQAVENGWHLNDKLISDIGSAVNALTGRGDLPKWLATHRQTLNAVLFSPGLMASRLNFLNPYWYMRLHPAVRQEMLKTALRLVGTLSAVMFIAKAAGARVGTDPRNADFAKIRIGNTRMDVAGGFQQYVRLLAQLYSGQIVSSTTGKVEQLSGKGFGQSRLDVAMRFGEGKAAPVPSLAMDVLRGSGFGGQKVTAQGELASHFIPILWQDLWEIRNSVGNAGTVGYGVPDVFGVGVQNYGPKKAKASSTPLSPASGSIYDQGSPYSGGSYSSGGSIYDR